MWVLQDGISKTGSRLDYGREGGRGWDKGIGVASFHKLGKMGDDLGTTLEMLPDNPPYFDLKFDIRWRQLNDATL